jgi:acetamidase/formamidase
MLELLHRRHGLSRRDALAVASIHVDLRITQMVNRTVGVHAVLRGFLEAGQ